MNSNVGIFDPGKQSATQASDKDKRHIQATQTSDTDKRHIQHIHNQKGNMYGKCTFSIYFAYLCCIIFRRF